jgi:hypothetical protein
VVIEETERIMQENAHGAIPGLTLEQIAEQDRARIARQSATKQRARRRHGNAGSRVWGYAVPASKLRRHAGK